MAGEALSTKDRKGVFSGLVLTGMVEGPRTLALYLKELQLRDRFGGILDWKKMSIEDKIWTFID